MSKNNKSRAFIGDVITTNDSFQPVDKAGVSIDLEDRYYRGIIVSIRGDYFGVRFGSGLNFTNLLDGLLSKPVGCLLKRDEFDVDIDF